MSLPAQPQTGLGRLRGAVDLLLILLVGLLALLMNCNELYDADIWWHLRSGEWIVRHGWPPAVDPFSFGSEGRPWIDLHWLFQLLVWLVFQAGGLGGVLLFAAVIPGVAVVVAVAARPAGASLPVVLFCWLPALVLINFRGQPRPEILTLLYLACYFAILSRVEERPRLAWLLPVVQLLWVNSQGLFALGPIVLALWLLSRAGTLFRLRLHGWSGHVLGASLLVGLVCFVNPYGVNGALFPLVLYPKVTQEGNPYKETAQEFFSARKVASLVPAENVADEWFFGALHLVLLLLPLGFLLPALWEAGRRAPASAPDLSPRAWLIALGVLAGLLALRVLTLTASGSDWFAGPGSIIPYLFVLVAIAGAVVLWRRSVTAGAFALVGGIAMALWIVWVHDHLLFNRAAGDLSATPESPVLNVLVGGSAIITLVFLLRFGANRFALLAALAFGYLALSAVNNWGRFGLVAGVLLSMNLGGWVGRLVPAAPRGQWIARLGVAGLLAGGVACVLAGSYGQWTGRVLGLREKPLLFPHDAVRFAAQAEMPEHALLYPLDAASLYIYYHAPGHLTYMDPRLEVPSLETFQTYLSVGRALNEGNARGGEEARDLGARVVVLTHPGHAGAEALLMTHPEWRLVYFDALASVFLPRADAALAGRFPTLDPGVRHFRQPGAPPVPDRPGASLKEARALHGLALALQRSESSHPDRDRAVLLAALGRADAAAREDSGQAAAWMLLGDCYRDLLADARRPPPETGHGWKPETELGWAHAMYCLERAAAAAPEDPVVLRALYRGYAARGMSDARLAVGQRLLALGQLTREQAAEVQGLNRDLSYERDSRSFPKRWTADEFTWLLDTHQPKRAAQLAKEALDANEAAWDWNLADRVAGACLALGEPDTARRLWQAAGKPPSEAVRQSRLGDAAWVGRDFETARGRYREARRLDPRLAEPCWALAWLCAERGEADAALEACRAGISLTGDADMKNDLKALQSIIELGKAP